MDGELPLRPMTVGELLDASVVLLRRSWPPLVALGLLLSAGQLALLVLAVGPPTGPVFDSPYWFVWGAGWLGTEAAAIAILAAPASVAAGRLVVGAPIDRRSLLTAPGGRWPATVGIALLLGGIATGGALACGITWFAAFGAGGLVIPVLIMDRATGGQVVARPLVLLGRGGLRAGGIRLLGYLGWLAVRLAVGIGAAWLLARLPVALPHAGTIGWLVVDALAYPALACLDACLQVENRMRTEGLDLALAAVPPGARRAILEATR